MSKDDDIRNRRPIKIAEVNVLKRLKLSMEECADEIVLRRFCANNNQTLPGMLEIRVSPVSKDDSKFEKYEWHVEIFENPSLPEGADA